jgi:molybdate transport system substrate-binding protein
MKKILALLLALCMMLALAACGETEAPKTEEPQDAAESETPAEPTEAEATEAEAPEEEPTEAETPAEPAEPIEIVVFAAASMTETLNELKTVYEAEHPGVTILYNFDSSGTLKTQIEEGATCDLFISAGQKQMNQLDISASAEVNTDGLDFVQEGTRINLLENKVVLVVPANNPKGIESFDMLAQLLETGDVLMAMGGADVPVGQYTQKILAWYGLDEAELSAAGCISYGGNVKQVTTQVEEGSVDCGVVYCTDAFSSDLTVVDSATAEMCGQVIYPAAVMKNAPHPAEALEFLTFLQSAEAMAVFESVGFSPAP